ncbi:zinc-binding dehydrogenase [Microbulbifer spongiae]|uniref:Alcohol dehydrogenase-like C-terminal domain-containing protein n=1 Tax=Microbulbifer spongiae TaxID=2944933 RepID=A0ABY9EAN5_9GAMM|nr:zinc-binding dehydrogenase [Microbulbifer sp. MI-G]WKD49737.1 hypothetical protein M8T91_17885 [Microbulbifer sp. MI-G]
MFPASAIPAMTGASPRRCLGTPRMGVREQINGAFFNQSAFATHAIATENNVVVIDKGADLITLAPLGCGFQTGAGAIMNSLRPEVGASLLVTGAGNAGLAAVMAVKITGCDPIIILDTVDSKLELALDLGATQVINGAKTKNTVSAVKGLSGGCCLCH